MQQFNQNAHANGIESSLIKYNKTRVRSNFRNKDQERTESIFGKPGAEVANGGIWGSWFQLLLIAGDLILVLIAETVDRSSSGSTVLVIYIIELVLMVVNIVALLVRLMGTILFKSRLLNILVSEFKWMFISWFTYLAVGLICRAFNYIEINNCNSSVLPCEGMSPKFTGLFIFNRLASLFYYFEFYRGLIQICDIKYYRDSLWLRKVLSNRN